MENNFKKNKIESIKKEVILGKYYSTSIKLKNNKKIRPKLIKINSLDEKFINVDLISNKFTILNSGKIIYKIYLNSIINKKIKKTLELNVFINNKLEKTLEYPVKENFNDNVLLFTELKINKGDVIYFNFSIKEKIGKLYLNDFIYYDIEFSLNKILSYKSSQIKNDSFEIYNDGINSKLNKIILNENEILNLEKQLSNLELKSNENLLPIGTVLLGQKKPIYGEWESLGILENGQTIIGGESSNGSVMSHNHMWSYEFTMIGNLDKENSAFSSFNTFDKDGNLFWFGKKDGTSKVINAFTTETGSDKNYACGVGIGTGVSVFKRIS